LPPLEFSTTIVSGGMVGYHGKQGFQLGGIPPHLRGIGGRGGWPFLSSSPLSKYDEEMEESLGGFLPLPLAEECLLDCLFDVASWLVPREVDYCESPFYLLLGLAM
jgi:hypothetical protein